MNTNHSNRLRSPDERFGTLSEAALPPPSGADSEEERTLVRALRGRDESAFEEVLDRYYTPMLRLAGTYVRGDAEAEEVVQDTWLAVLNGIERFDGRSSLKTWIFRILVNRARTRAKRESRVVSLPADRDWGLEAGTSPGPDERLIASELGARIEAAIETLPPRQREVITLRDVEGWTAAEVSDLLDLTEANQRVLLHRARVKVRDSLAGMDLTV